MTIAERFAKFTTEELENAMSRLNKEIAEIKAAMMEVKSEELRKMGEQSYNEKVNLYLDIKCAYDARL